MKQSAIGLLARFLPALLNTRGKQRLNILIYHRVLPDHDPMRPAEPTTDAFSWQMRLIRDHFAPLPLVDALNRLLAGTLPDRAVCVTFDDGYADNEKCALPILQRYGIPATVFVATGFLNGGRMWNDSIIESLRVYDGNQLDLRDLGLGSYDLGSIGLRKKSADSLIRQVKHRDPAERMALVGELEKRVGGLPDDLMLTDAQLQAMAHSGIDIGAHTVNHPILSSVSDDNARREIVDSKNYLEGVIQKEVEVFAYPNGKPGLDYKPEHPAMVRDLGFRAAVSTHQGVGTSRSDRYQLPRFTPWDREAARFAVRLLANYRQVDPLIAGTG